MTSIIRRVAERTGAFFFNLRNAYYERSGGEIVPTERAIAVVDRRAEDVSRLSNGLIGGLVRGDLTTRQWAESMAVELRRAHTQVYALGRGGWQRMTAADRATVTARLRSEFGYLRGFAKDVQSGKMTEAQIRARADMYATHIRSSFHEGKRAASEDAGKAQERRVLNPAEHCGDCEDMASEGWQELGHFPVPGDGSQCKSRCKCSMEFR